MKDKIRFETIACPHCKFLGQFNEYDLFYCPDESEIIIGFKDEGAIEDENFNSICVSLLKNDIKEGGLIPEYYREAYKRAKEQGYIKQPVVRYTIDIHDPFTDDLTIKTEKLYYSESLNPNGGYGMQCAVTEEDKEKYDQILSICENIAKEIRKLEEINKKG